MLTLFLFISGFIQTDCIFQIADFRLQISDCILHSVSFSMILCYNICYIYELLHIWIILIKNMRQHSLAKKVKLSELKQT